MAEARLSDDPEINTADCDLDGKESPNWIAVRKSGLTKLVKELEQAQEKILELEKRLCPHCSGVSSLP